MNKDLITSYNIGPWKFGQNKVQPENGSLFQVPDPKQLFPEESIPQLTAAVNVDLDNDGSPQRRAGLTEVLNLTAGVVPFSGAGLLLVQDGGTIKKINLSNSPIDTTTLVSGLSSSERIRFYEFEDQIFYTDGTSTGVINASGTASNWGQDVPVLSTLTTTTGSLPSGYYQVTATTLDGNSVESGAGNSSYVTLTGSQSIVANLSSYDSNATQVRFYATYADVKGRTGLFLVKTVAISTLPTIISDVQVTKYPLRSQFQRGPVPGDGIFSYKRIIMTWKDNWIYPATGRSNHLFNVGQEAFDLPTNIRAAEGLESGFYVATEDGMYFYSGKSVYDLSWDKKDNKAYTKGSKIVSGKYIPEIKTNQLVALFVNEEGLVAGLPSGNLIQLKNNCIRVDNASTKDSTILRRENGSEGQILVRAW